MGVFSSGSAEDSENSDLDRIFNPLAFPDEKEGVRVLIQATKPLEVSSVCGFGGKGSCRLVGYTGHAVGDNQNNQG